MPKPTVPDLPTLVVGDQTRRLVVAETTLINFTPGAEVVRIVADGPDGTAVLVGPLAAVYAATWQLDARLADLARGEA